MDQPEKAFEVIRVTRWEPVEHPTDPTGKQRLKVPQEAEVRCLACGHEWITKHSKQAGPGVFSSGLGPYIHPTCPSCKRTGRADYRS